MPCGSRVLLFCQVRFRYGLFLAHTVFISFFFFFRTGFVPDKKDRTRVALWITSYLEVNCAFERIQIL